MKNFLVKEIRLCLSPINYIFLLFTCMIMIPNYPCYVPFFYISLSVFFIFNNAQINRDVEYSLILPIRKKDIVKSRCILVGTYEAAAVLFTVPFAVLNYFYCPNPAGNEAGIDANVAFYGLVLICMTVFHFVLFTSFYKKAVKPGLPFLLASIAYFVMYGIFEFPVWTKNLFCPFGIFLDSNEPAVMVKQLYILAAGLVVYIAGWFLTYRISAARFEKADI